MINIKSKMKGWIVIFLTFILPIPAQGQLDQTAFQESIKIYPSDPGKLFLGIQNYNLFKNNEYFNNIEPGYTTFGSAVNASLKYYPTSTILIEAGIHMLTFYGTDKFDQITPIIRFQYQPFNSFNIIFGNIYGGLNHGLIEPLYRFERYMEVPPETGLQLLYTSTHFDSDLYVDWMNYIFRDNYSEKEKFTLGWINKAKLMNPERNLQVEFPLQILSTHMGSQIDTSDISVETLMNLATGAIIKYRFNSIISEVGAIFYYALYNDLSNEKTQSFDNGNAIYPLIYAKSKWLNVYLGYWNANNFIAPLGEPIFSSISHIDENLTFPKRELILFKFDFHHKITRGVFLGVRYEAYIDLLGTSIQENKTQYDFSYGVYINFNRDFFITDIKKFR